MGDASSVGRGTHIARRELNLHRAIMFNHIHDAEVQQDLAVELGRLRHLEDDILIRVRETVRRLDARVRHVVDESGAEAELPSEANRNVASEPHSEDW